MPDLLWRDVEDDFDLEWNGAVPDIRITGTSVEDWQAVLDLIRSKGWPYQYSEDARLVHLPSAEVVLSRSTAVGTLLRVHPTTDVELVFRPRTADSIEFDLDLRELQGQAGLNLLCSLLRVFGRRLDKAVVMTPEHNPDQQILGYDPGADKVVLLP